MAVPGIADEPLAIVYYPTSAALRQTPYAAQLVKVVNDAFRERNTQFWSYMERVEDFEDLVSDLGADTFSYVITSVARSPEEAVTVYGMGSAHPFDPAKSVGAGGRFNQWKYVTPAGEDLADVQRWELKVVVTDPRFQRAGFGSRMMDLVEMEVRRHARRAASASGKTRCQMVLTTVKEVNEAYYLRFGYRTVFETHVPKGTLELSGRPNMMDLTVASMNRFIPLD